MRYLVVDGYNVLHAGSAYEMLAARDLDAARVSLVEDVAAYAAGEARAYVVFDAAGNPLADGRPHHVAGVAVIFSPAGRDADSVIEELAHRFRGQGHEVVVATSDAQTQWAIMGAGAVRMSSAELVRALDDARVEREGGKRAGSTSGRLEDRIDEGARDALWRWARGL